MIDDRSFGAGRIEEHVRERDMATGWPTHACDFSVDFRTGP